MKSCLDKLPKEVRDLIILVSRVASRKHLLVYLVGGFVRDLILGVKNLDLDIVVEGDGIKFAEDLVSILKVKLIRHRRFGTATLSLGSDLKIDVATARREEYLQPAQLPSVMRGSLKDDLKRRDFSINAMAISIASGDFGRIIDLFGGMDDLRSRRIRVLHDLSFVDDPTRILRAIRFEKRYNFKIEPKTLLYLREAIKTGMLERVEPQRLRDELILLLKEKTPLKIIKRANELVSFNFINKNLSVSKKEINLLSRIEKEILWFRETYSQRRTLDAWLIYFMGLIDSLNIDDIELTCERFAFRKGEVKRLLSYRKIRPNFIRRLSQDRIRPSLIFVLLEPLSYEAILMLKAKYKNRSLQKHIRDFFEIYNGMRLLVSGDDLHKLGVTPGPYYQRIFSKVLRAKLEGLVKNREDELLLMRKLIKWS